MSTFLGSGVSHRLHVSYFISLHLQFPTSLAFASLSLSPETSSRYLYTPYPSMPLPTPKLTTIHDVSEAKDETDFVRELPRLKPLAHPSSLAPLDYLQNNKRGSITDPSLHATSSTSPTTRTGPPRPFQPKSPRDVSRSPEMMSGDAYSFHSLTEPLRLGGNLGGMQHY